MLFLASKSLMKMFAVSDQKLCSCRGLYAFFLRSLKYKIISQHKSIQRGNRSS